MIRTLFLTLLLIILTIQVQAASPDQEYQAVRSKLMQDFQAQGNVLVHCSGVTFFPNGNWVSPDGKSAGKLSDRGRESVRNILQVIQNPERKLRIPREFYQNPSDIRDPSNIREIMTPICNIGSPLELDILLEGLFD